MDINASGQIVIGVDHSADASAALAWAAEEADRTRRDLLIAHAPTAPSTGQNVLDRAAASVARRHPKVRVRTELQRDAAASMLIRLADSADEVVVGIRSQNWVGGGVFAGSTARRVAVQATCPIVVVRGEQTVTKPVVVVGVSDSHGGRQAMQFAGLEARARGCQLIAVRSFADLDWSVTTMGGALSQAFHSWVNREAAILADWVSTARTAYPDIDIVPKLTAVPVGAALHDESVGAILLVVGCRRGDFGVLSRLGPTAHWALHHTQAPVAVVSHTARLADPSRDHVTSRAQLSRMET
jgi:nucleotide-binding universal stress UspA family protein